AFDALNRLTNIVDGVGTNNYTYTAAGQLSSDDGPFDSDAITNTYVNRLRTRLSLQQFTDVWTNAFAYDSIERLSTVSSPAGTFTYTSRPEPSTLISKLLLPNTSYITNAYDGV